MIALWRYAADGLTATVLGSWSELPHAFQAGTTWPLEQPLIALVLKNRAPGEGRWLRRRQARRRDPPLPPVTARVRSVAGAPIIVDGASGA